MLWILSAHVLVVFSKCFMTRTHAVFLYHTEVQCPSGGLILSRLLQLRSDIKLFLENVNPCWTALWHQRICWGFVYLTDIFPSLHHLNVHMQGKSVTCIDVRDKIWGFQTNLDLWFVGYESSNRNLRKFPTFDNWKLSKSYNEICNLGVEISQHLVALRNSFDSYFGGAAFNNTVFSINHPFEVKLKSFADDDLHSDKLIVLECSTMLYSKLIHVSWNGDFSKFLVCLGELITYLSEVEFTSLITVDNHKNKTSNWSCSYRWRKSSSFNDCSQNLRILCLVQRKQADTSHWVTDWLKLFVIYQ